MPECEDKIYDDDEDWLLIHDVFFDFRPFFIHQYASYIPSINGGSSRPSLIFSLWLYITLCVSAFLHFPGAS
jgi:hypothetical protein